MKGIPKIIHFVFLNPKEPFPDVFNKCLERAKSLHPGWKIFVHNQDDAERIILQYIPEILPIFRGYGHYVQRADLIRAILMYVYGGFYMDLDMFCLKPLNRELLKHQVVLPVERSIPQKRRKILERLDNISVKHLLRLGNYMFGSVPKDPFWLFYLKEAIKKSSFNVLMEGDILETTGPSILTNVYHQYKRKFPEITILKNTDRNCLMPYHKEICCHFGNYAAHLHQGTWRWQHLSKESQFFNNISTDSIKTALKCINQRIKKSTFLNLAFVNSKTGEKNNLTKSLSQQISFTIKEDQNVKKNFIIYNLCSLTEFTLKQNNAFLLHATLVITESFSNISQEQIEIINKCISICFVFMSSWKEQLLSYGIKVRIQTLPQFYLPVKRTFSDENSEAVNKFTVGIFIKNPNQNDIKAIFNSCLALGKRDKTINIVLFYAQKTTENFLKQNKKLKLCNISNAKFSNVLNSLCCFISPSEYIEDLVLANTCIFTGIPVSVKKNSNLNKRVLKFCKEIESDDICNEIIDLKNNYHRFNIKSIHGAKYLEDKFSLENITCEILLKTLY